MHRHITGEKKSVYFKETRGWERKLWNPESVWQFMRTSSPRESRRRTHAGVCRNLEFTLLRRFIRRLYSDTHNSRVHFLVGKKVKHWLTYQILSNSVYCSGQCVLQWPVCTTVDSVYYSGQCVLQWPVCNAVASVYCSGPCVLQWPVCTTVASVYYSGQCVLQWTVFFTMNKEDNWALEFTMIHKISQVSH